MLSKYRKGQNEYFRHNFVYSNLFLNKTLKLSFHVIIYYVRFKKGVSIFLLANHSKNVNR
jgi:hypothetical protein